MSGEKPETITDGTMDDTKEKIVIDEAITDDKKTTIEGVVAGGKQKVIIDTDCGVDDALAILLTLSSKDIAELLAVTCCYGNTSLENVCSNVMRVLTTCDEKQIPIHRGCRAPLLAKTAESAHYHGRDGLGNSSTEFSTGGLKENAVSAPVALVDYVKKYPKQISLIAIGPLTNIAMAHKLDPTFTQNLKSLFIMGGNYKGVGNQTEVAEFNFYCDPESADIILKEAECPITLVPWETSLEYGIKWELYENLAEMKGVNREFFGLLAKLNKEIDYDDITDSDVLATVAALYPECVKSTLKHPLAVEVRGQYTRGLVILRRVSPEELSSENQIQIVTEFFPESLEKLRKIITENAK